MSAEAADLSWIVAQSPSSWELLKVVSYVPSREETLDGNPRDLASTVLALRKIHSGEAVVPHVTG